MQNLNIILYQDSEGNLIAKHACYDKNILHVFGIDDFENLIGIEYLLDANESLVKHSVVIKHSLNNAIFNGEETIFKLPSDGMFTYFNFIIPELSYFQLDSESEDEEPMFFINQDEVFYHNGQLMAVTIDVNGPESSITNENTKIIQVHELPDYLNSHMLSFQKVLFSLCKLQKCLLNLQKRILDNTEHCNGFNTSKKSLDIYHRDFLFSAIYTIKYLTDIDNFEEAHALLTRINDCSGSVCKQASIKHNCNCGNII